MEDNIKTHQDLDLSIQPVVYLIPFICVKRLPNSFPVGTILRCPSTSSPEGFIPCDGRRLFVKDYPELFRIIGFLHDPNSKSSNTDQFAIPDLFERQEDRMLDENVMAEINEAAAKGKDTLAPDPKDLCPTCGGYGAKSGRLCNQCSGTGLKTIDIPISDEALKQGLFYHHQCSFCGKLEPFRKVFVGKIVWCSACAAKRSRQNV